jgi:signal transduction histidine kinase
MALTRRVNKSDGSFGGVVAVSLDPHYLANFYRQIDLGKYGIVALIGADSSMRARRQGDEVSYGQDLTGSAVMKAAFEQVNGTTANVARVDGVKRLYSFRKVGDYPLWIFVASGEEEALADTNKRAHLYRWFGGILSLLILGFSLTITRDIARRKKAETRLANSEMQLRTIIENEPDAAKEAAEAASRAKSTFLANMSHELRTPMNGVMGMVDMALRRATDPQQIDWLNKSKSSAQHLLAVINDILDISKIEADRLTLETIHFKFGEVLENLLSLLGHKAQEKQIKLLVDLEPEVPRRYSWATRLRLGQILLNLTGNALKFTDHGLDHRACPAAGRQPGRTSCCASKWPTPASALPRKTRNACSLPSSRPMGR